MADGHIETAGMRPVLRESIFSREKEMSKSYSSLFVSSVESTIQNKIMALLYY